MQTNPAVEKSKIIRWSESPCSQSTKIGPIFCHISETVQVTRYVNVITCTHRKSHTGFPLVSKLVTLNDLEPLFCVMSPNSQWRLILHLALGSYSVSSRLLYAVVNPSVCLSSATFVRRTRAIEIFGNISTPFGTMAIRWHSGKILPRSSQGNISVGERG